MPTDYPKILHENRLDDATPVASTTATGFNVLNLRDFRPYTKWQPTALPATITVNCGVSKSADYWAIYGHDLYTQGATIYLRGSTDNFAASDVLLDTYTPIDNTPFARLPSSASYRYWRIKIIAPAPVKKMYIGTQEGSVLGITMSADGTKLYAVGNGTDTIYQYTLSTPYDLSTGSYASKSLSVAAQATTPQGIAISGDGLKVYVVDSVTDTIYQYTLATANDISTGTYASKSLSVAAQDISPAGLIVSPDGSKLYISGLSGDKIYQYTLSTPYDLSTGSYASKSLSVAAQETNPYGLAMSSAGDIVYVIGNGTDTIYQYTLSTPYDISTGSYASKSLSIAGLESNAAALFIAPDGNNIYFAGQTTDYVYQIGMATAGDISTGSTALTSAMPTLAIAAIGLALDIPAYLASGFDPLGRVIKGQYNRAELGHPLGRTVKYEEWAETLKFETLTWAWLRATWLPAWRAHVRDDPFIFVWDPIGNLSEIYLVAVKDKFSTPHKPGSYADLTFEVSGVVS